MAEELQYNKRKFDDPTSGRRPTGFSAPIAPPTSDDQAPPPAAAAAAVDGIELAKQRAQEIAARIFSNAEAKRPKFENGGGGDDSNSADRGFSSAPPDYLQKSSVQALPSQGGSTFQPSFPSYGFQGSSKRIDVPNGRVGVIIGKGGETIRYLQLQSGAKIQVTRDAEADYNSQTRPVDLVGTPEQISKAEQMISDVLAEAEVGGSGIVGARKVGAGQGGGEQFTMRVPNNKVGLIIGKGGETIKSMQAKSGARIQLIPLHPPPDYALPDRVVQIDGTNEQIEIAKQLVTEVTSENRMRNTQMTGGYAQQGYRPRPPMSWGQPGAPPMQQPGYGYLQPGAYPGPPPPYNVSQPPYGGYPPPSSGWDQSSNPAAQQTTPGSGYDYYNQQQPQQQSQQPPAGGSSVPADNTSYNYSQQPANYNSQGSYGDSGYPQSAAGQQGYGQEGYSGGYQAPTQPGYPQPVSNQPGYEQQQGYSATPAYGATTTQDGPAAAYGAHGTHASAAQPVPPPVQSSTVQQGYSGQQSATTAANYPSQGTTPVGYAMTPTMQATYGSQPPAQAAYGQPAAPTQASYGQSPQGQKPSQAVYGQSQQPPATQSGTQPAPVQSGYSHGQPPQAQSVYAQDPTQTRPPPSSGFVPGTQPSYGQQQSYGGVLQAQPSYGQQQQQTYADSYGNAGYSQPPGYSSDNTAHGTYDGSAVNPAVPSGATKPSSQS